MKKKSAAGPLWFLSEWIVRRLDM